MKIKPSNDEYGYRNGDDVMQINARILGSHCDLGCDFLRHIGGDDWMIIFQSPDWKSRCRSHSMLDEFAQAVLQQHAIANVERGGYVSGDRIGKSVIFPIVSLSLGATAVDPDPIPRTTRFPRRQPVPERKQRRGQRTGCL